MDKIAPNQLIIIDIQQKINKINNLKKSVLDLDFIELLPSSFVILGLEPTEKK